MSLGGLILISLALGLLAWLAFLWSVKSGQYDDPEGPKYRMLHDDDDDPPLAPKGDDPPRTPPQDPGASQPPGRS